jgi:hypothetical protein
MDPCERPERRGILLMVLGIMPETVVNKINGVLVSKPVQRHRSWVLPFTIMGYGLSIVAQVAVLGRIQPLTLAYTSLAFMWLLVLTVGGPGMFSDPDAGIGAAPVRT